MKTTLKLAALFEEAEEGRDIAFFEEFSPGK
jgi:hypothetical protein